DALRRKMTGEAPRARDALGGAGMASRLRGDFSPPALYIARNAEARARLFRNAVPAADRIPHARGPAAARAGNSGALGKGRSLRAIARRREGPGQIHPA